MTFGAIVAARLDSERLPGKVLKETGGHPLLWYIVSRCRRVEALEGNVVVATTSRNTDNPIAEYCTGRGWPIFRGSFEDVAGRLLECAEQHRFDWFFRVNGDTPFVDPGLLTQACGLANLTEYELVTNLCPRSFPYGVSVELVKTPTFADACSRMKGLRYREHPTSFFYENIVSFKYRNLLRDGENLSATKLTVDTPEDFALFSRVVAIAGAAILDISYAEAARLYKAVRDER